MSLEGSVRTSVPPGNAHTVSSLCPTKITNLWAKRDFSWAAPALSFQVQLTHIQAAKI